MHRSGRSGIPGHEEITAIIVESLRRPHFEAVVYGIPKPMGDKVGFRGKGGRIIIADKAGPELRSWKQEVRSVIAANVGEQVLGPVAVGLWFYYDRPASHYRTGRLANILKDSAPQWKQTSPDREKLDRTIMDCMSGLAFRDDSQVALGFQFKLWLDPGIPGPKTVIRMWEL